MLVTQAQFARMKSVSAAAVSQWKSEGRLVIVGNQIDFEATERRLKTESSFRSKRVKPATATDVNSAALNVKRAEYANGSVYDDSPANLPSPVVDVSVAIYGGGFDLARLLLSRRMPIAEVKAIVDSWIREQLDSWLGGPGLPDGAGEDWPDPPLGFDGWHEHPLFTDASLPDHEWAELIAEAAAGGAP